MISRYNILKWLALTIFILPIFYGHFTILPSALGYLMDLILAVYFLFYKPLWKAPYPTSGFKGSYGIYVVIILLISFYSVVIHSEGVVVWFQEFRRLVYPFLFYLMFTDVFAFDQQASRKFHKLMMFIFLLQVPVTIIQRTFYSILIKTPLYSGGSRVISELDFAMGTLGGGGASYLGVLIPMAILYMYDTKQIRSMLIMTIPIFVISSGGGLVLMIIAYVGLGLYVFIAKSFVVKFKFIALCGVAIALFVVLYSFPFFQRPVNDYLTKFVFYSENYVDGERETFANAEHKLSRINGHKFLRRQMNEEIFEPYLGMGFKFKENNGGIPYQFKNDLNFFLAERGILGLGFYGVFIIAIMFGIWRVVVRYGYEDKFVKLLYFGLFFVAGFYNPSSRSFHLWFMFVYFLVLLENREQYLGLSLKINEDKYNRRREERGLQIDTMSGESSQMS